MQIVLAANFGAPQEQTSCGFLRQRLQTSCVSERRGPPHSEQVRSFIRLAYYKPDRTSI